MVVSFVGYGVLMFHSSLYGEWFHAVVMATSIKKERTKLVEKLVKSAARLMVSGKVVILLREVSAKIMGVVAVMTNSACFFPLFRVVQLSGRSSSGSFPSVEGLESSRG